MEFWLIKDGEKEGPILDFELRSRIRTGDVVAEQKVWYTDLDGWTPIGEVELFSNEFETSKITSENVDDYLAKLEEEEPTSAMPPPIPAEIHLWRRFGARWFDYMAYMAVFFGLVVGQDIDLMAMRESLIFPFVLVLPWIFMEAAALNYWGTTPGKWLVGLKVRGPDLQKLSVGAALLRTSRVMILGMGFAQPILREICHLAALWFAVKKKVVLWDTPVGIRLERCEESPLKWVAFGLGMMLFFAVITVAAYQIGLAQLSPEELEELDTLEEALERVFTPQKR